MLCIQLDAAAQLFEERAHLTNFVSGRCAGHQRCCYAAVAAGLAAKERIAIAILEEVWS